MDKLTKALTDYIIKKGMIKEEERSLYEYGLLLALETMFNLIVSLLIAVGLQMVVEGVLFFIIFIPLRSYAGGLHLDHYWSCFILSCLVYSVVLLTVKFIEIPSLIQFPVLSGLIMAVWKLYPVENSNRSIDEEEKSYFRRKLKLYLLIDLALTAVCLLFGKQNYVQVITLTFLMVVVTMILGKIKNSRIACES